MFSSTARFSIWFSPYISRSHCVWVGVPAVFKHLCCVLQTGNVSSKERLPLHSIFLKTFSPTKECCARTEFLSSHEVQIGRFAGGKPIDIVRLSLHQSQPPWTVPLCKKVPFSLYMHLHTQLCNYKMKASNHGPYIQSPRREVVSRRLEWLCSNLCMLHRSSCSAHRSTSVCASRIHKNYGLTEHTNFSTQ